MLGSATRIFLSYNLTRRRIPRGCCGDHRGEAVCAGPDLELTRAVRILDALIREARTKSMLRSPQIEAEARTSRRPRCVVRCRLRTDNWNRAPPRPISAEEVDSSSMSLEMFSALYDFCRDQGSIIGGLLALAAGYLVFRGATRAADRQVSAAHAQTEALRQQNRDLRNELSTPAGAGRDRCHQASRQRPRPSSEMMSTI